MNDLPVPNDFKLALVWAVVTLALAFIRQPKTKQKKKKVE